MSNYFSRNNEVVSALFCLLWLGSVFFFYYYDCLLEYLGSWGMTSLRRETGETHCTSFKMWLKVGGGGNPRVFRLMIALAEKVSPEAFLSSPKPG